MRLSVVPLAVMETVVVAAVQGPDNMVVPLPMEYVGPLGQAASACGTSDTAQQAASIATSAGRSAPRMVLQWLCRGVATMVVELRHVSL
jgi:hypothetical protein